MIEYIKVATDLNGNAIYGRIDDDGLCRYTCTEDDAAYQAWLNPKDKTETL